MILFCGLFIDVWILNRPEWNWTFLKGLLWSWRIYSFDSKVDFVEPFSRLVYACLFKPGFGLCGYQGPLIWAFVVIFLENISAMIVVRISSTSDIFPLAARSWSSARRGLILAAAIFEVLTEILAGFRPETRAVLECNKLFQAFFIALHGLSIVDLHKDLIIYGSLRSLCL